VTLDGHPMPKGGTSPAWQYDARAGLLQIDLRAGRGTLAIAVTT